MPTSGLIRNFTDHRAKRCVPQEKAKGGLWDENAL